MRRLVAGCAGILLAAASPSTAMADARMTVRLDPATSPVSSGDYPSYNGFIQCSIPGGCLDVTVTFAPPPDASGPGVVAGPYPPGVTDVVANPDGTVTVTFDRIDAGASSQLTVSWPTADHHTAPGEVEFVSATPAACAYDPSTHTVSMPVDTNPDLPGSQWDQITVFPYEVRCDVTVRIVDPDAVGLIVQNNAAITGTPFGGGEPVTMSDSAPTTVVESGSVTGEFTTYTDSAEATPGQTVQYILSTHNNGTSSADLLITDVMPAGFDPTRVSMYVPGQATFLGPARITVSYGDGTGAIFDWTGSTIDVDKPGTHVSTVSVAVPSMATGARINVRLFGVINGAELPGGTGEVRNCADFALGDVVDTSCSSIQVHPQLV